MHWSRTSGLLGAIGVVVVVVVAAATLYGPTTLMAVRPSSTPSGLATPGPSPRLVVDSPQSAPAVAPAAPGVEVPGGQTPAPQTMVTASPMPNPTPATWTPGEPPFAGGLLIADRMNDRLLVVDAQKNVLWTFPVAGSLPLGQTFSADDAFLSPDGMTITANEENAEVVVRIDVATRKIVWEYGRYGVAGSGPGYLNTPDDAYPLANGDVMVADINNCRILEIASDKSIARQWGTTRQCGQAAPFTLAAPNGATPLPDGGLLITEIDGSRVIRLDAAGNVVFNIHVPASYPSDAQLDANGNVIVADYAIPGAVLALDPSGHLLWRYRPLGGAGMLEYPSLAVPLENGLVALNDDFRARVQVIAPQSGLVVWQYGATDRPGKAAGRLFQPDGIDLISPARLVRFTAPSGP